MANRTLRKFRLYRGNLSRQEAKERFPRIAERYFKKLDLQDKQLQEAIANLQKAEK